MLVAVVPQFFSNVPQSAGAADTRCVQGRRFSQANPAIDSYSAFFENDHKTPTGLHGYLQERGIGDLTMVGLALDFCVNFSAVDAARLGYMVEVEMALSRGIDADGSMDAALAGMREAGVSLIGG